jgi:crossover junction endodeoxyribonuclease RuvC
MACHLHCGERMFDTCVLGVDPGVARSGIAVVARDGRRTDVSWAGTVRTSSDMPEADRLAVVAAGVREAIVRFGPSAVAIERVAWNRNHVSALQVARATGVVMAVSAEAGLEVEEYSPSEVKSAVTGMGNATKEQIVRALVRVHRLQGVPDESDAADAVAVALTHLVGAPLRGAARNAGSARDRGSARNGRSSGPVAAR